MPITNVYFYKAGDFLAMLDAYAQSCKGLGRGAFEKSGIQRTGLIYVNSTEPLNWLKPGGNFTGNTDYEGFMAQSVMPFEMRQHPYNMHFTGSLKSITIGSGVKIDGSTYSIADAKLYFDFGSVRASAPTTDGNVLLFSFRQPKGAPKTEAPFTKFYSYLDKSGTNQIGSVQDDTLYSFKGNDTLKGNGGTDTFVFRNIKIGLDTIRDFDADNTSTGHDKLRFSTDVFETAEQVVAAAAQVGNDVVITLNAQNTITLADVEIRHFDTNDILVG